MREIMQPSEKPFTLLGNCVGTSIMDPEPDPALIFSDFFQDAKKKIFLTPVFAH
jgi:hypothetical protein